MSTKMNKKASSSSSQLSSASSTPVSRRAGSPLSPTNRFSRLQEKHDLQNLNDRLACYIDKVRRLETENSRLNREVQTKEENITREISNIKAIYDNELTDARRLLDETAKERAKLEIDIKRLWDDCEVLKTKFEKKSKDCQTAENALINYEKKFNELQVQYNHLLADKKNSSQRVEDLEKENARLQTQLDDVRNHLEEETLHRIDLENHIQSLKEEATFKDQVFQQELSESRTRRTVDISEIDGRLAEKYEAKMKASLQEIRDQYEAQMRSNREEIEALYENKIKTLQQHANRNSGAASMAVEELRQTRAKIDALNERIVELESGNNALKCKIRELENLRDMEKVRHAEDLATLEAELARMREEISQLLQEYQDLMDIRVALDLEIAAYSKLLESEEARLNITPGSQPTEISGRAGTPSRATPLRAVKRKRTLVEENEQRNHDFSISNSAKGDVEISDVDPEGKFVKLTNKGDREISLSGWQVARRVKDLETIYKFNRSVKIEAGGDVCVWSVDCGATHNPPSNIVMKTQKWPVGDNMVTLLISNDGEEMATSEWIKQDYSLSSSRHSGYRFNPPKGYQPNESQGEEKCCVM